MKHKTLKNTNKKTGFTLLEIIIAVGIFSVISILTVGSFLSLVSVQKKTQKSQEILNEFRFSLDLMGKELTSGSAFPDGCEGGCDSIVFASKVRPDVPLRRVVYYLGATGLIMKGEQKTYGPCATIPLVADCYQPFTSDKVQVDKLAYFVNNKGDDTQVITTVVIAGVISPGTKNEEDFHISTSFSPRLLQNPSATPPVDNEAPTIAITQPTNADTFTTIASFVALEGTASDNVAVVEIRWRNETTGASGFGANLGVGFSSWDTLPIALLSSVDNVLVVNARDAEGNTESDTLIITSTAPLNAPTWVAGHPHDGCAGSGEYVHYYWNSVSGAENYEVERCEGAGCSDFVVIYSGTDRSQYEGVTSGASYSYRVRAWNSVSGYTLYSVIETLVISDCGCPAPTWDSPDVVTACDASYVEYMWVDWYGVTDPLSYADSCDVERCVGVGCSGFVVVHNDTTCHNNSYYEDYDVVVGQSYSYRVIAHYDDCSSDYTSVQSDIIEACIPPTPTPTPAPPTPTPTPAPPTPTPTPAPPTPTPTPAPPTPTPTPIPGDYSLTATPKQIDVGVSGSNTVMNKSDKSLIRVTSLFGYDETVTLSASGGPAGTVHYFQEGSSLTAAEYTVGTHYYVKIPGNTSDGVYQLTVTGVGSDGLTRIVNIDLNVYPSPGGES